MEAFSRVAWYDIEVGEIFAIEGCWVVAKKISDNEIFVLADDGKLTANGTTGKIFKLNKIGCYNPSLYYYFKERNIFGLIFGQRILGGTLHPLSDSAQKLWEC